MIYKNVLQALMLAAPKPNTDVRKWLDYLHIFDNFAVVTDGHRAHIAVISGEAQPWLSIPLAKCNNGSVSAGDACDVGPGFRADLIEKIVKSVGLSPPLVGPRRICINGKYLNDAQRAIKLVTQSKSFPILSEVEGKKYMWSNGKFAVVIGATEDEPYHLKGLG